MTTKEKTAALWKKLADEKKIAARYVAAHCIIRAMHSRSNEKLEVARALLLRAFTPITNANRLANGATPFDSLKAALYAAASSPLARQLDDADADAFASLCQVLRKEDWADPTYAYILVRSDLPKVHQLVQAAHATMVMGQQVPRHEHDARRQHFCVLDGGNESELRETGNAIQSLGLKAGYFWEPDAQKLWGGLPRKELTAIALHPMRKSVAERKRFLSGKKLLEM
jgi:hypothetical protein